MKVYLVSRGSYSSYGIERAFATSELAQAFIDAASLHARGYNDINASIEELEILEALPPSRIRYSVSARWNRDTAGLLPLGWYQYEEESVFQEATAQPVYGRDDPNREVEIDVWSNADYYDTPATQGAVWVFAWDLERARKVFGETKAQKGAQWEGLAS